MQDERSPGSGTNPADDAARDVEAAEQHAERRVRELKEAARREIEETDANARDRDEVGERPVPPKSGR